MDQTISERFVKLSSRIPFPKDLKLGDDIDVVIGGHSFIGNVVKIETEDNQDNSVTMIYKIKFLSE
jgi:hypothetical protein